MYLQINPFWRNVLTVMAGTILSQGIPMAVLLVLTRIVAIADIGDFYLLLSASNISSIVAAASLDKAIFSAYTEEDIIELIRLTVVTGCVVGLAIFGITLFLQISDISVVDKAITKYSLCFIIYSLFLAFKRNLQAVLIYRSQFLLLNKSKLIFATPAALAQLVAGILGLGVSGLIYSTTLLSAISTLISWRWLQISWQQIWHGISIAAIKKTLIRNQHFIIFSLAADLVSTASSQLPILIVATRFGSVSVAMYALLMRVLSIPVGLLGSSILTVFKDRAGEDYRNQGNCIEIYLKTLKTLALLSFLPFSILHLFGADLVKFLLGDRWIVAGEYTEILAPMLFISFISSPLSYVLFFSKHGQVVNLLCQMGLSFTIWLIFSRSSNMHDAISYYAWFGSIYYILYIFVSYRAASGVYSQQLL